MGIAALILTSLLLVDVSEDDLSEGLADSFEAGEYHPVDGQYPTSVFNYRLFVPRSLKPGERCPMLLWLHGYGEFGLDNRNNLRYMYYVLDDREHLEKYRFFILSVQCPPADPRWTHDSDAENSPTGQPNDMLTVSAEVLRKVMREYPVDEDRVYLSGVSSGGTACWDMAMRHPDWFAAVVPMGSGGGDVSCAALLKAIPIWAFHNVYDPSIRPDRVKETVAALNDMGGNIHLTMSPTIEHDCWTTAFVFRNIMAWMLAQRREAWVCWTPPGCQPWRWWHILAVPSVFLVVVWLGWRSERRRRQRKPHQITEPPGQETSPDSQRRFDQLSGAMT